MQDDSLSSPTSAYTLWVDILEDLPSIDVNTVLSEAGAALFNHLSPLLAHGHTPTASIKLATNEDVQALNRDFRDQDKPTNVLSFPSAPEDAVIDDEPDTPPHYYLGDIILAAETLLAEAEAAQIPVSHHLAHLAIHGLLHLIGFDHENEADAALMEALEVKILSTLNIKNPYQTHETTS